MESAVDVPALVFSSSFVQLQALMHQMQHFLGLPGRRQKTVEASVSISVKGLHREHKKGLGTLGREREESPHTTVKMTRNKDGSASSARTGSAAGTTPQATGTRHKSSLGQKGRNRAEVSLDPQLNALYQDRSQNYVGGQGEEVRLWTEVPVSGTQTQEGAEHRASSRVSLQVGPNLQCFSEALEEPRIPPENTCFAVEGRERLLCAPNSHLQQGASVLHHPPGEGFTV